MWQLVAARGIQGLGAGAIFPLAMATIADLFSPSERGRYQGLFGAVFGLSSLLGPAIGGLITDTIGWPFVFFVNIPIGLVVLFTIRRYLPAYHLGGDKPKIDYLGAALFTGALVPILIGLTNKQSADWTDLSVGGLILLGVLVLGAFVWIESRAAEPIVPLELFRNRAFSGLGGRGVPGRCSGSSPRSCSCRAGSRSSAARPRRSRATRCCRCSAG